jgi:hypothetical protein
MVNLAVCSLRCLCVRGEVCVRGDVVFAAMPVFARSLAERYQTGDPQGCVICLGSVCLFIRSHCSTGWSQGYHLYTVHSPCWPSLWAASCLGSKGQFSPIFPSKSIIARSRSHCSIPLLRHIALTPILYPLVPHRSPIHGILRRCA